MAFDISSKDLEAAESGDVETEPANRHENVKLPGDAAATRNLYFINEIVEWQLTKYIWTGCTRVALRDEIMSNATELIRQIIRKQGLHTIYPGQDESSFGDLLNTAWCVHPDTMVFTPRGIQTIGDLIPSGGDVGDLEDTHIHGTRGMAKATKWIRMRASKTLHLTTSGGYRLRMSPDHRMPALDPEEGGKWITVAKDLEPGQLIGIQFGEQCFGSEDDIEGCDWEGWKPTGWSPELAYIIGLIAATGVFSNDSLLLPTSTAETADALNSNSLGIQFEHKTAKVFVFTDPGFMNLLRLLGISEPNPGMKDRCIPKSLWTCSRPVVTAFLRGLFDAAAKCDDEDGTVSFFGLSFEIVQQIQVFLLNYGVVSELCDITSQMDSKVQWTFDANDYRIYELSLSPHDSKRFYEEIGFSVECKQQMADHCADANDRYLPVEMNGAIECALRQASIDQDTVRSYVGKEVDLGEALDESTFILLAHLICEYEGYWPDFIRSCWVELDRIVWQPIAAITEDEGCETLDVEIPASGDFVANGIYSLNCQIERTLYKYRSRPHCRLCYNPERPANSTLHEPENREYGIKTLVEVVKMHRRCPYCNAKLLGMPIVEPMQGRYGGSETILYRGMSKVFNMWSQIARTVILAYIKKEARDRKNSNSYVSHLDNKPKPTSDIITRFLSEAKDICQYHDDYLRILESLEWLIYHDDRPYDGIISKLINASGLSRPTVTGFMRFVKLRSLEFTDSPMNRIESNDKCPDRRKFSNVDHEEE